MRASLLIATHNEGDSLWKTIRSCVEGCAGLDYEIVVADDASTDGSVRAAEQRYPQIRVAANDRRQGASPTKHLAAVQASGDVLVFLDGHCNPEPGSIRRLVEDVEELAGQAIITPRIPALSKCWTNQPTQVGHGYRLGLETFDCGWLPLEMLRVRNYGNRKFYESPALIGCALAIARELYDELHGFDPHMLYWGVEDLDFGLRCWMMGHPILHDPESVIGHRFRQSFDNYSVPFDHLVVNQLRMAYKCFTQSVWSEWLDRCRQRSPQSLDGHPEGFWAHAWELFQEKRASAESDWAYIHARRERDEFWYAERFGLPWPKLASAAAVPRAQAFADQPSPSPSPAPSPSPPPLPRPLIMSASVVNQDDPTNTTAAVLVPPRVVYGGSEASTSDKLTVSFALPSPAPTLITWSMTGPPGATYTTPAPSATAIQWVVGALLPVTGIYTFSAVANFADGSTRTGAISIEVGIRTDDVIVVGWIDPTGVTMPPTTGVTAEVVTNFPTAGPPVPESLWNSTYLYSLTKVSPTPKGLPLSAADGNYLIKWLFKYAANPDPAATIPGGNFRDPTNTMISYAKVNAYQGTATNYKPWNRLQVRFRVGTAGFNGAPVILQQSVGIGTTVSPIANPITGNNKFPGQSGPNNNVYTLLSPTVPAGFDRVSLINDGSPDSRGINATNMAAVANTRPNPVFWENIGSQIRFTWNGGTSPTTVLQPYPTYNLYQNGTFVSATPQASSPLGNFVWASYPFGTAQSSSNWEGSVTLPGGRDGDATSPADPNARFPKYILP